MSIANDKALNLGGAKILYDDLRGRIDGKDVTGPIAPSDTATATEAHTVGDVISVGGQLYVVTAAIAVGDTITEGTNVESTTVMAQMAAKIGEVTVLCEAERQRDVAGEYVITREATEEPVPKAVVEFTPYQNLNGKACPTPASATGKNLINLSDWRGTGDDVLYEANSGTVIYTRRNGITGSTSLYLDAGSYTISIRYDSKNGSNDLLYILVDGTSFQMSRSTTDKIHQKTFEIAEAGTHTLELKCGAGMPPTTYSNVKIQLEAGSSVTEFEEPMNICPILQADKISLRFYRYKDILEENSAVSDTSYDVALGDAYYGAIAVVKGDGTIQVIKTYGVINIGELTSAEVSYTGEVSQKFTISSVSNMENAAPIVMSDRYKTVPYMQSGSIFSDDYAIAASGNSIYIKDSRYTNVSDLIASGGQIVYKLRNPVFEEVRTNETAVMTKGGETKVTAGIKLQGETNSISTNTVLSHLIYKTRLISLGSLASNKGASFADNITIGSTTITEAQLQALLATLS